jgi:hypothetical protein
MFYKQLVPSYKDCFMLSKNQKTFNKISRNYGVGTAGRHRLKRSTIMLSKGATTFSVMTLSIMTLSPITSQLNGTELYDTEHNVTDHNGNVHNDTDQNDMHHNDTWNCDI